MSLNRIPTSFNRIPIPVIFTGVEASGVSGLGDSSQLLQKTWLRCLLRQFPCVAVFLTNLKLLKDT